MPSNMVPGGDDPRPLTSGHITLHANAPLPLQNRWPITSWSPRSGRNDNYHMFVINLDQLLSALGADSNFLDAPQPNVPTQPPLTRNSHSDTINEATDALMTWQRINTSLYYHVSPALMLEGVHKLDDARLIAKLAKGQLADGQSLLKWAFSHVDLTTEKAQAALARTLMDASLRKGANLCQLRDFLRSLHEHWSNIEGNQAPSKIRIFWKREEEPRTCRPPRLLRTATGGASKRN